MAEYGALMAAEIAETPIMFKRIFTQTQQMDRAMDLIRSREVKSVVLVARGTSDNAAFFLKYLIETKLGLPVSLASPSIVSIYQTKLYFQQTLVLAISQSGESPDLVAFVKAAFSGGAKVIAMTNDENSPLALASEVHINLLAGPELSVAATKSYSAQLLTSYLLVSNWAGFEFDEQRIISESDRLIQTRAEIKEKLKIISLAEQIIVLGRAFSYPHAREAALKIQETCKVAIQGLPTSDYLHGPISALNPRSQVFLITPMHAPLELIEQAVTKIRSITPHIFWIGSGGLPGSEEIQIAGSNCGDEIASCIVDAVLIQYLTLDLALGSGLNPDAPIGLSKITKTI
jgi:glucosamine--fructose-6-phosphate aminotransferase (isomerizing)